MGFIVRGLPQGLIMALGLISDSEARLHESIFLIELIRGEVRRERATVVWGDIDHRGVLSPRDDAVCVHPPRFPIEVIRCTLAIDIAQARQLRLAGVGEIFRGVGRLSGKVPGESVAIFVKGVMPVGTGNAHVGTG